MHNKTINQLKIRVMKTKKIIVGLVFVIALLLLSGESTSGDFETTLLIKLGGIICLILCPALWFWFGLDKDEKINKFLNED